jgi:hypothetical protein
MTDRYPNRKYCIINTEEIDSLPVDFSQVLETGRDTLRYSVDETKTFVKYDGEQPSFLNGKTEYSYTDFKTLLKTSEWTISK